MSLGPRFGERDREIQCLAIMSGGYRPRGGNRGQRARCDLRSCVEKRRRDLWLSDASCEGKGDGKFPEVPTVGVGSRASRQTCEKTDANHDGVLKLSLACEDQ
jgi:hypothetical protein